MGPPPLRAWIISPARETTNSCFGRSSSYGSDPFSEGIRHHHVGEVDVLVRAGLLDKRTREEMTVAGRSRDVSVDLPGDDKVHLVPDVSGVGAAVAAQDGARGVINRVVGILSPEGMV